MGSSVQIATPSINDISPSRCAMLLLSRAGRNVGGVCNSSRSLYRITGDFLQGFSPLRVPRMLTRTGSIRRRGDHST